MSPPHLRFSAANPEMRAGPPWVMEEMIVAQATVPEALAATATGADALLGALRGAARHGERIVTTGSGTSEHAACALALVLADALGVEVEARQALEATLAPRAGGVCVAVSHGGLSKATVGALEAAHSAGAATALITAAFGRPADAVADHVVATPLRDRSMCHTVAYTSPILIGMLLAAAVRGEPFPAAAAARHLRALLALEQAAGRCAAGLAGCERLIAAGSGADTPAARELALKVAEGARIPASFIELEDVVHGHLVAHDQASALVVLAGRQPGAAQRAERATEVLASARRIGVRTAAIAADQLGDAIGGAAASAGTIAIPASAELGPLASTLLGEAIALQLLTVALTHQRKTNPDLLRREEQPYLEAVALGNAKFARG